VKVLLSWLREYVEIPFSVGELEDRLPMLGLGIEGLERLGDDAVIDLEIPANRGDLMGMLGVARELAASARAAVRAPVPHVVEAGEPLSELTGVEVQDTVLCPRFTARMIVDARVGPSPSWLARRLEAAGLRAINNIVDVTNYVMLETGQPMHAFDYDLLRGGRLVVRHAGAGEELVTLDGVGRTLDPQTLVVADAERAGGVAGIIGGGNTEISERTSRVLLEAASWDPAMIRRTSRRLGVRTESSARFERGIDTAGILAVQDRAIALMRELAGGRILRGVIDVYPRPLEARAVDLRWASVRRLLGIDVPEVEGIAILQSLGFAVERRDRVLHVGIPTFRRDVEREEDLVEDVARHHGYDHIPAEMPVEATAQGSVAPSLRVDELVRTILVRAGLVEALTLSLTNPAALDALNLPTEHPWRALLPLRNPMVEDHTHLRTTLLPGLLNAARANASRGVTDIRLFELGRTFHNSSPGIAEPRQVGGVAERRRLAILMTGTTHSGVWNLPTEVVTIGFYHLKGIVEILLHELHVAGAEFRLTRQPWLHPGHSAEVAIADPPRRAVDRGPGLPPSVGTVVGTLGELHPDGAARYDLPPGVYLADLDIEALLEHAQLTPRFVPVPRFPAVRRDVALILPRDVPSAQVEQVIRDAGGDLLEAATLFDVYEGAPVPAGQRSLAYALSFRAPERTLAAEEVEIRLASIHEALRDRLRAKIRE
jgi:phenylalanyl-tRNA synthetase beta chain